MLGVETFGEEGGDGKTERDDREHVEEQEDEEYGWTGVVDDGSLLGVDAEEQCHDGHRDDHEDRELEEPGGPVDPGLHTHQFHRLLQTITIGL